MKKKEIEKYLKKKSRKLKKKLKILKKKEIEKYLKKEKFVKNLISYRVKS